MKIQKFERIDAVEKFATIVFTDFQDLQYQSGVLFTIDSIKDNLKSKGLLGWFLINDDNKILGYIIGEKQRLRDGRYVYYLSYFFVVPAYRNAGLGKKMMQNCLNHIKNINIPFVILTCEVDSVPYKLYKNLGFIFDPIIKIDNSKYTALVYYTNENIS